MVILADDFGYGSLNCYGADKRHIRTPGIDRLAHEGIRFTDANTPSSVCTPSRYGLLTGRYCWRTALQQGTQSKWKPMLIETTRPTLASSFAARGYACAAIGKWHLGYGAQEPTDYTAALTPGPLELGFHRHFGVPSNHGDRLEVFIEDRGVHGLRSRTQTPHGTSTYSDKPKVGLDAPVRDDRTVSQVLTTQAADWIAAQPAERPICLYFTPVAVHVPVTPSAELAGTQGGGAYADWIAELDRSVGGILAALERSGRIENTLLVFTSDNGGALHVGAEAAKLGLRINGDSAGGKAGIEDGGFRVPYLVRWPGRLTAGHVDARPFAVIDTLASVAAACSADTSP